MRRRLSAALPLIVVLVLPSLARATEPDGDATIATPDDVAPERTSKGAAERPSIARTAAALALMEGLVAGWSAAAAYYPEPVGWLQVVASPLACMEAPGKNGLVLCGATAAEFAGLGMYNALELRGDGYSRTERFWRNVVAWHAMFASIAITGALLGDDDPTKSRDGRPAVSVAFASDATPLLVVGAKF